MHHLVYLSEATRELHEAELRALLVAWRANNRRLGITGVLLYREGHIIQVLEGNADAVHALFARIADDARHHNVTKLADGPVARRDFADWSMGFVTLPANKFAQLRGYFDPAELAAGRPGPAAALDAPVLRLLKDFALEEAAPRL